MHDQQAMQRLDAAARKGNATQFATGINPGVMFERMAMAATGLCNDVQHISLAECVNCESMLGAGEFLSIMGFGMETVNKESTERIAATVKNYLAQYLYFAAEKMGREIERIELWLSEYHFSEDGYVPSLLPLAAAASVASALSNLKI